MGVAEAEGDVEEEASYNNNHPKVGSLAVLNILEESSFHRTLSVKDPLLSANCVRSTFTAGETHPSHLILLLIHKWELQKRIA